MITPVGPFGSAPDWNRRNVLAAALGLAMLAPARAAPQAALRPESREVYVVAKGFKG